MRALLQRWFTTVSEFTRDRPLGGAGALIILLMVAVAVLGSGIANVILAIAIPMIPRAALVVRSSALALRQMPFVEAALTLGSSHWRIIIRHMLPNVMAPYLIILTAFLGQAILLE